MLAMQRRAEIAIKQDTDWAFCALMVWRDYPARFMRVHPGLVFQVKAAVADSTLPQAGSGAALLGGCRLPEIDAHST
jgi:hypothetical protein